MLRKEFKDDLESKLLINIYLDDIYQFTHLANPLSTLTDLKKTVLLKLKEYSVNYKMEYNDQDISHKDDFTMFQIFNKVIKDEYNIYITLIRTLKKYENQKVLMTYHEGDSYIIVFRLVTMKWNKIYPQFPKYLYQKFPYNSRHCHMRDTNIIVITGGIDHETSACYFDFDTTTIVNLDKMKYKRERHAMISLDKQRVFIVGGDNCKKVTLLDIEFESYQQYPETKFERKDPSVCLVDDKYLYVFMGYCNEKGGQMKNFEKLDISEPPYSKKWELLPMNNPLDLKMPKSYSGVVYCRDEGCFIFLGGSQNATIDARVIKFIEEGNRYVFEKTKLSLPFECGFCETAFVQPNELVEEFYQFTHGRHRLIRFNVKEDLIEEIQQEWLV